MPPEPVVMIAPPAPVVVSMPVVVAGPELPTEPPPVPVDPFASADASGDESKMASAERPPHAASVIAATNVQIDVDGFRCSMWIPHTIGRRLATAPTVPAFI